MRFQDFLKEELVEANVTVSGPQDAVAKLKALKQSLDNWLQSVETLEGNHRFMVMKSAKNSIVQLKKVADSIDKTIEMDNKYRNK